MGKFSTVPDDVLSKIQLGAGILLRKFDPASPTFDKQDIFGSTSGGLKVSITPSYSDYGEDIDNVPNNTMELKRVDSIDIKVSGSMVTLDTASAKALLAAADVTGNKITLRKELKKTDFSELWFVGDYSQGDTSAGFIAVKFENILSTGGFSLTTTDNKKGVVAFEFTAHFSLDNIDKVPVEVYIKEGE